MKEVYEGAALEYLQDIVEAIKRTYEDDDRLARDYYQRHLNSARDAIEAIFGVTVSVEAWDVSIEEPT